jgi:prophage antirepressor-like protein
MSSIVSVFENLLKYNNKEVFIVLDINNEIWFKIKDVLKLLGYHNISKINRINGIDKINIVKFKYIKVGLSMTIPSNTQLVTLLVNEPGLYQLLSNSYKSMAIQFRNDLFTNILPTIRKTGLYKLKENDNIKLKAINEKLSVKIKKIEEENNKLFHLDFM